MTSNDDAGNVVDEKERLEALATFASRFDDPGATPGEWSKAAEQMPWFDHSALLKEFMDMAYAKGWIAPFDWSAWVQTPEGSALMNDHSALATATSQQLSKVLTAVIRAERFSEGTMEEAFSSGLLLAAAKRATNILSDKQV